MKCSEATCQNHATIILRGKAYCKECYGKNVTVPKFVPQYKRRA